MRLLFKATLGYLDFLCRAFQVAPDQLGEGRRDNPPLPEGAAIPYRYT